MAIHDRIKKIQEELGSAGAPLSIPKLAERGDVTRQALNKIIKQSREGHESGHRALEKCAALWGYSYDWLMTGRGSPKVQQRDALEQAIELEPWDSSAVLFARALSDSGKQHGVAGWVRVLRAAHEAAAAADSASAPTKSVEPTK